MYLVVMGHTFFLVFCLLDNNNVVLHLTYHTFFLSQVMYFLDLTLGFVQQLIPASTLAPKYYCPI